MITGRKTISKYAYWIGYHVVKNITLENLPA